MIIFFLIYIKNTRKKIITTMADTSFIGFPPNNEGYSVTYTPFDAGQHMQMIPPIAGGNTTNVNPGPPIFTMSDELNLLSLNLPPLPPLPPKQQPQPAIIPPTFQNGGVIVAVVPKVVVVVKDIEKK